MKYKFVSHIPDFCSDAQRLIFDFDSYSEMIRKVEEYFGPLPLHWRYVTGRYKGELQLLMILDDKGTRWKVLGYTGFPLDTCLPCFEEERKK